MGFRSAIFKIILFIGFLLLLARLASITIIAGSYYKDLSAQNRIREIAVFANRGIIYDRFNKPLVINAPIFIDGESVISKEDALFNPKATMVLGRKYLLASASAHLLGYLNLKDRYGIGGIEEKYNDFLTGTDGKKYTEVDAAGKYVRDLGQVDPKSGQDLILSLDSNLQQIVFTSLTGKTGAAIVSNWKTGEVLALFSSPSFDPNVFTMPAGEDWDIRVNRVLTGEQQPMFNRVISGTYPPGSTFKLISAIAGLESKTINSQTKFEDTGVMVIGQYKFPNWKWLKNGGVDGWITVVEALQKSNDLFFYQMGGMLGIEKLEQMAKRFGLANKLGIDLSGEAAGIFRTDREWFLGDTYHTAIGQGEILTTPLQVNSWTATVANGGVFCRPHLSGSSECKSLNLNQENIRLIKSGMKAACSTGGTAWPLFDLKIRNPKSEIRNLEIYCKTGTAEFGDPKGKTHAWLTGFLDEPAVAVTVLVEAGGEGSDAAAPIVKEILQKWLN